MNFLVGELSGDSIRLPIGDVRIPDELRRRLESGPGGGRGGVVAGLRPEHFEDASLIADRSPASRSRPRSTCSSRWAPSSTRTSPSPPSGSPRSELEELAQDAGAADLPSSQEGIQVTARLAAESRVRQGAEAELWFDSKHLQLFDPESGRSLLSSDGADQGASRPATTAPGETAPGETAATGMAPGETTPTGTSPDSTAEPS